MTMTKKDYEFLASAICDQIVALRNPEVIHRLGIVRFHYRMLASRIDAQYSNFNYDGFITAADIELDGHDKKVG